MSILSIKNKNIKITVKIFIKLDLSPIKKDTETKKTKNIKKVSFGAKDGGGNLAVKLDDPKRRKAFADRHNCKGKKDKTKPGYWACRIGRYWKSLGGSKNYPGFW